MNPAAFPGSGPLSWAMYLMRKGRTGSGLFGNFTFSLAKLIRLPPRDFSSKVLLLLLYLLFPPLRTAHPHFHCTVHAYIYKLVFQVGFGLKITLKGPGLGEILNQIRIFF